MQVLCRMRNSIVLFFFFNFCPKIFFFLPFDIVVRFLNSPLFFLSFFFFFRSAESFHSFFFFFFTLTLSLCAFLLEIGQAHIEPYSSIFTNALFFFIIIL